jgi:protein-S-isoprenylcysteine O-methyltransferase Ste14
VIVLWARRVENQPDDFDNNGPGRYGTGRSKGGSLAQPERKETVDSRRLIQRLRVPAGFVVGIVFVWLSRPTWLSIAIGMPVALLGAAVRAWASGHLRKNAELAVCGPYAYTRNPLYLGSLIMAAGCAVCGGHLPLGLALMALFLAIYLPVMQAEAVDMRRLFAADYERWAAHVPLLLPRATPYATGLTRRFDSRQYLRHREYRAATGLVLVVGLLALKAAGLLHF